jgi:PST family polysaccharide transporter/lipopolysaccharide exporter
MGDRLRRLFEGLVPEGGILEQTVKSGVWNAGLNVAGRGLEIVALIVLAALLGPADFGLMGIALLTFSGLNRFSELGLETAVIQQKERDVDHYLNTMLSLQAGRGLLLAAVMFFVAPVIGSVFSEPRAVDVIRVLALMPLLVGIRNPAVVYFKKNLQFHKEFVYQLSGSMLRFVVSIVWAVVSPSVWALVFGLVASEFARTVLSYLLHEFRPWPELNRERAMEFIGFGKWITGSSILYFLYSEGDDALVGYLLSATALGFYQTAYRLSNAPATEISQVISGVVFPAFSSLQEDMEALRSAYFRTLQLTMFISVPVAFGIAAVAPVFVPTFLGEKWLPAVTVIQILAAYGMMRSLGKTMSPIWNALGRPDYVTKLSAIRVVVLAIVIVPMTLEFGIEGAALAVTGVYIFPMLPLDTYVIMNSIKGSYTRFARELAYPVFAGAVMFAAVVWVDLQNVVQSGVLEFCLLVLVGTVVYLGVVLLLAAQFGWGITGNLRSIRQVMG